MNKFKHLWFAVTSLAIALIIPFTAACNPDKPTPEPDPDPVPTLQSITVDSSKVKKDYFVGEDFSADGLVVKANIGVSATDTEEKTLSVAEYTLDLSKYNKNTAGTYAIGVSYTYSSVTKTSSFDVTVKEVLYDGLEVTLAEGVADTYTLSAEAPTAEIDVSKIVVKEVTPAGTVGGEVSGYTAKLYKGSEEVALTENKAVVGAGAYNIWVTKDSAIVSGYVRKAFVLVYVVDTLASISFNAEAQGTLTEQTAGKDTISETWTFTATYASGATKPLAISDVTVEGLDTAVAGENKTATVSYKDTDVKGTATTKTVEVNYKVTEKSSAGQTNNYALDIAELQAAIKTDLSVETISDKTPLKATYFTGKNAFITLLSGNGSSDQYRTSNGGIIEIKGDRLQVTFQGTGTITISFASTGGSNVSNLGLKGVSGYVAASETTATAVTTGEDAGTYSVTGTSYVTVTYTITTAGNYTICSPSGVTTRGARISSITMTDTTGSSTVQDHQNALTISELQATIKADLSVETIADKTPLKATYFTGKNAFITLLSGNGSSDQYRTSNGGIIEIKGDRLQVTFQGTGTITISFASTGGSNVSNLGLKGASGYVAASETTATAVTTGDDAGTYSVTGTSYVTVTYTITTAGTYTICSPSGVTTRGARISAITMVDRY